MLKSPWPIKAIRLITIVRLIGCICLAVYAIWASEHIPASEFGRGFRDGFVARYANPETGVFGPRNCAVIAYLSFIFIPASLILVFIAKRSLLGVRTVFAVEVLFALSRGALPLLSSILLALTFLRSAKRFFTDRVSNNVVQPTTGSTPG